MPDRQCYSEWTNADKYDRRKKEEITNLDDVTTAHSVGKDYHSSLSFVRKPSTNSSVESDGVLV